MIKKLPRLFRKLRTRFRALSPKRRRVVIIFTVLLIVAAGLGVKTLVTPRGIPVPDPIVKGPTALQKGTPTYATVLPEGKTIDALGGWTRVSPPDRNPVYAYVDMIGKARVIVSQQELPDDFASDPDGKTKELATGYNATKVLTVGSTTAYIGVSTQETESVILHIRSTLVLIKSDTPIDENELKNYINSLT